MKKQLLIITIFSFIGYSVKCQDISNSIYFGFNSGGHIINYTEIVPPYYRKLNWVNINLYPKLGFNFNNNISAGFMGSYSFYNSTLGNAEPTFGGGYFLKYTFNKRSNTRWKEWLTIYTEWQQIFFNGYYIQRTDLLPQKIYKSMNNFNLHLGLDIRLKKVFSIGLSYGVDYLKFYKNYMNYAEGERLSIKPYGRVTFQYYLKLKNKR